MIVHAYPESYLSRAQSALGDAFDYAINTCSIPGEDFTAIFSTSSISKRIENGEPAILAGKSGTEIALDIIFEGTGKQLDFQAVSHSSRSREYWIGWAVCFYQWYSSRSFREIFSVLSYEDLKNMYYTLHEADVTKFVEIVNKRLQEHFKETRLKAIRTLYGCSQSELAKLSGVSLRSIQMYEQRNKDINKASAETLYRISKVLGCTIEDLLEKG